MLSFQDGVFSWAEFTVLCAGRTLIYTLLLII